MVPSVICKPCLGIIIFQPFEVFLSELFIKGAFNGVYNVFGLRNNGVFKAEVEGQGHCFAPRRSDKSVKVAEGLLRKAGKKFRRLRRRCGEPREQQRICRSFDRA